MHFGKNSSQFAQIVRIHFYPTAFVKIVGITEAVKF